MPKTGANKPSDADPRYFMPFIENEILPEKVRRFFRFGVPEDIKMSDHSEVTEKIRLSFREDNCHPSSTKESHQDRSGKQSSVTDDDRILVFPA